MRIVDILFPRYLLLGGRVSVHVVPKFHDSSVDQTHAYRRSLLFLPVGGPFPFASEEANGAVSVRGWSVSIGFLMDSFCSVSFRVSQPKF